MERKAFFLVSAVAGSLLLAACATTQPTDPEAVAQSRQQIQDLQTEKTDADWRRVRDQRSLRNQRDRVQAADVARANELNVEP